MASALSMIAAAGRAQRNRVVAIVVVFVVMMVGEYSYSRFLAWQDVWKAKYLE